MFGDKEWGRNDGYPTPVDIPLDTACALIRVPCDTAWQAVLFGLLFSLTSPEAWQQFEGGISRDEAAERWEEMFNQARADFLLGCDVIFPSGVRWDADCDCVEVEGAGGVWTPNPLADPRHGGGYLIPPLDTDDPRCDAAQNMTTVVKSFVDGLESDADALVNAAEILGGLAVLVWGFGMLVDLVLLVAEVLVSIGVALVKAAFTDDVYASLKCIFYCRIDSEGQVSVAALALITTDINDNIGGIPATVMGYVLNSLMGEVGLSNAGALGDETGDCSDCECSWCVAYDFTLSDGGFTTLLGQARGVWNVGVGWQTEFFSPVQLCQILKDWDTGTLIDAIHVHYTTSFGSGGQAQIQVNGAQVSVTNLDGTYDTGIVVTDDPVELFLNFQASTDNTGSGQITTTLVTVQGHGVKPTDADYDC